MKGIAMDLAGGFWRAVRLKQIFPRLMSTPKTGRARRTESVDPRIWVLLTESGPGERLGSTI